MQGENSKRLAWLFQAGTIFILATRKQKKNVFRG